MKVYTKCKGRTSRWKPLLSTPEIETIHACIVVTGYLTQWLEHLVKTTARLLSYEVGTTTTPSVWSSQMRDLHCILTCWWRINAYLCMYLLVDSLNFKWVWKEWYLIRTSSKLRNNKDWPIRRPYLIKVFSAVDILKQWKSQPDHLQSCRVEQAELGVSLLER